MRHRLEFVLFQLFKWFILLLPLKSAQRLGRLLGSVGYHLITGRREITLDNLHHAFPEKSEQELERIAKGAFQNYGITMLEFLWFPNLNDETIRRLVRIRNPDIMIEAYKRGKGVVLLAGHFGNWELDALAVPYLTNMKLTVLAQTQSNPYVNNVINRHRCLFGNKVVSMGMSVREIVHALGEGGAVAIAPDQSAAKESIFIDFFGRRVSTHKGPAVFTLRSGAALQIGFMLRQRDGTYEIIFEEIPTNDMTEYSEDRVVELTKRHTVVLEKYIRQFPDHWLWMHRRWKHTDENVKEPVAH